VKSVGWVGRMVMLGDVGWLALEGVYYASDSALRRFYAGERWIWLNFLSLEEVYNFERNRHFAGMNTAQNATESIASIQS
jgi:hypothetical protein